MNSDGSRSRQLTEYEHLSTQPTWSPDGRKIAFASTHASGLEIHVMDLASGHVSQITNSFAEVGGDASDPHWSPDSKK